jgi:hypothetical protein
VIFQLWWIALQAPLQPHIQARALKEKKRQSDTSEASEKGERRRQQAR